MYVDVLVRVLLPMYLKLTIEDIGNLEILIDTRGKKSPKEITLVAAQ